MSGITGRNTKPEVAVRRYLHRRGLRFRVHTTALPGRPDVVLRKHRAVVFVHGCFWHRHRACKFAYTPKSNRAFWIRKFAGNVERDARQKRQLITLGWRVLVVWECQVSKSQRLETLYKSLVGNG